MALLKDKLTTVKTNIKIVDVLKRHGVSVPDNTSTQLSCPFHGDDMHPSARVYTNTQTMFCFTCQKIFDAVAVEMEFTGRSLNEALDELIAVFDLKVEESSQDLQRFYGLAARYVQGDAESAQQVLIAMGERFRVLYMSQTNWRMIYEILDHFWNLYDELYNTVSDLMPQECISRAVDWYAGAYAAVNQFSSQLQVAEIGPEVRYVESEED